MVKILVSMLPLVFMFGIMYLLLIRPQQKKQKAMLARINAIEIGDSVETIGGICGTVTNFDDTYVFIESDKASIKLNKRAIAVVDKKEEQSYTETKTDSEA